ncbi:helix-turn-helix domain-containing protein [Streptomyces mutabilis]|uniref:helix-turn-helix domain-containing protein n=1 Tax=Streptomyces mutabilis TaxID=67332 RepID=UPI0034DE58E4
MPGPKDLAPSSSPRALLGAELRHAREKGGFSQEELGGRLFVSGSFIGRLESGTRRMQPEYARMLDDVLGTEDFFRRNCAASAKSRYPEHFAEAAEAERAATAIREYASMLIPGLLQAPGYARAVCRAYQPAATDAVIDELVAARMERARLLADPTELVLWAVIDEAALRRITGGRRVMADALRHLAGLMRDNRVIVQVLPFDAGAHPAMQGCVRLMDFVDSPSLVYLEGVGTGRVDDDPATVARYRVYYDLLMMSALPPGKSLSLIEELTQNYAHGDHP